MGLDCYFTVCPSVICCVLCAMSTRRQLQGSCFPSSREAGGSSLTQSV